MPRKRRELEAGGVYHVVARGNRRQAIFHDDEDRQRYLQMWGLVANDLGWRCLAYCLMDNHVHHLVETPAPDLDIGIRRAHSAYARTFNDRHGYVGHLFQGRYHATPARSLGALWYLATYVALNPVRAHLCDRPEDHPWSSHGAVVGRATPPSWLAVDRLRDHFAADGRNAVDHYAYLVEAVRVFGVAGFAPAAA